MRQLIDHCLNQSWVFILPNLQNLARGQGEKSAVKKQGEKCSMSRSKINGKDRKRRENMEKRKRQKKNKKDRKRGKKRGEAGNVKRVKQEKGGIHHFT